VSFLSAGSARLRAATAADMAAVAGFLREGGLSLAALPDNRSPPPRGGGWDWVVVMVMVVVGWLAVGIEHGRVGTPKDTTDRPRRIPKVVGFQKVAQNPPSYPIDNRLSGPSVPSTSSSSRATAADCLG